MIKTIAAVFWLACGVLSTGLLNGATREMFPSLNSTFDRKQSFGFSVLIGCMGPIGLIPAFFMTGFGHYGLSYDWSPVEKQVK